MAQKSPLVSVIIPYKEDRGWLIHAVQSVKRQTYRNIELILSHGDCGVSENINNGIEKSKGSLIKYLCEDDFLPEDSIAKSVKGMRDYDFIHGNATNWVNEENYTLQIPTLLKPTLKDMLGINIIHGGSLMYKREVFKEIGWFDQDLWTGEEYEFNLRALSRGLKLGYVNENLYFYRIHPQQKSIGNKNVNYQTHRRKVMTEIKQRYASK